MLTEEQIETIIAETCGTYRTGDSYTFEDVWNCIEKALAAHSAEPKGLIQACRKLVELRHSEDTSDHEIVAAIDAIERALLAKGEGEATAKPDYLGGCMGPSNDDGLGGCMG